MIAPVNITAANSSSTSILLKWLPILSNYSNGPILEYRITYVEEENNDQAGDVAVWQNVIAGEKLSVNVTRLKKFTKYQFRMAGINRRGVGVDSVPILASTDQDSEYT